MIAVLSALVLALILLSLPAATEVELVALRHQAQGCAVLRREGLTVKARAEP